MANAEQYSDNIHFELAPYRDGESPSLSFLTDANVNSQSTEQVERAGVSIDIADEEENAATSRKSKWAPFRVYTRSKESVADSGTPLTQPYRAATTTWIVSFFRWGPILGLASLLFVFLSIPASATVLTSSNNRPVESWTVKPSVYLAVFTGIGNKALAFAAFQGTIITWWLRALEGTTLRSLHRDWAVGNGSNLWTLVTAGVTAGNVGISALCASIIFVDGILLQLSTTTAEMNLQEPQMLQVNVFPEIPTDFTGTVRNDNDTFSRADAFLPVYQAMVDSTPIPAAVNGCIGICVVNITAAAIRLTSPCEIFDSRSGFVNLTALHDDPYGEFPSFCNQNSDEEDSTCPLLRITVDVIHDAGAYEPLLVKIGTTDDHFATTAIGSYTTRHCYFQAAVAEYNVTVYGDRYMTADFTTPQILHSANNTVTPQSPDQDERNSTLAGIASAARTIVGAEMDVEWSYTRRYPSLNAAKLQQNKMQPPGDVSRGMFSYPEWGDPLPNITAVLNEIMFRTSVHAAQLHQNGTRGLIIDQGLDITSEVIGTRVDLRPVFITHWRFFVGAAIIQLACVALVGNTFWGYWRLGRSMSLSPLEIAKAFDAPLLRDVPSNMNGQSIAKQMEEQKVRYGAVEADSGAGEGMDRRLIFDEPDRVYRPMKTFHFVP